MITQYFLGKQKQEFVTPNVTIGTFDTKLDAKIFAELYQNFKTHFKSTEKYHRIYNTYYKSDATWDIINSGQEENNYLKCLESLDIPEYSLNLQRQTHRLIKTSLPLPKNVDHQEKKHVFCMRDAQYAIYFEIVVPWDDKNDKKTLLSSVLKNFTMTSPDSFCKIRIETTKPIKNLFKFMVSMDLKNE
jgi:hypothetical protein